MEDGTISRESAGQRPAPSRGRGALAPCQSQRRAKRKVWCDSSCPFLGSREADLARVHAKLKTETYARPQRPSRSDHGGPTTRPQRAVQLPAPSKCRPAGRTSSGPGSKDVAGGTAPRLIGPKHPDWQPDLLQIHPLRFGEWRRCWTFGLEDTRRRR